MVLGVISTKNQNQKGDNTSADTYCRIAEKPHGDGCGKEDALMFTMLLPMRIVLSSLPESSITVKRMEARLSPCSARDWIRILFTVVIEVSADEKNADKQISIIRARNCMASLESNSFNSF